MELKEYMAPEMEVVLLKMEGVVCASGFQDEDEPGFGGEGGGEMP